MRDKLKSKKIFNESIEYDLKIINKFEEEAKANPATDPDRQAGFLYDIWGCYREVLYQRYSRGDDLQELSAWFVKTVESWEFCKGYLEKEVTDKEYRKQWTGLDFDNYFDFLWHLSFAFILKAEPKLLTRVIILINNQGKDALLDRILQKIGAGNKVSDKLLYPRPYKSLFEALDAPKEKQPALVARFLKNWYEDCKKAYWYNNGKDEDSGYFGYWCFESALVVRLWDIDDSSFADHPNYPKDLAHWRK